MSALDLRRAPPQNTQPTRRLPPTPVYRYEIEVAKVQLDTSKPGEFYREFYDAGKVELLATFGLPRGDLGLMALPEADKLKKAHDHVTSLNDLRIIESELGHIHHGRFSQEVRYYHSVGGGGRLWAESDRVCLQRMSRRLRPLICDTIYAELDLVNCHVVVMLGVVDALNADGRDLPIRAPMIEEYVVRREDLL